MPRSRYGTIDCITGPTIVNATISRICGITPMMMNGAGFGIEYWIGTMIATGGSAGTRPAAMPSPDRARNRSSYPRPANGSTAITRNPPIVPKIPRSSVSSPNSSSTYRTTGSAT